MPAFRTKVHRLYRLLCQESTFLGSKARINSKKRRFPLPLTNGAKDLSNAHCSMFSEMKPFFLRC